VFTPMGTCIDTLVCIPSLAGHQQQ
jgi:hypothetical protein